jgi:hypothetical protein
MSVRLQAIASVVLFSLVAVPLIWPSGGAGASPTGFEVAPEFQDFYQRSGGLPVFGYAVSEPLIEDERLAQYFERARFEHHPEHAGTQYEILLGHVGSVELERVFLTRIAARPSPVEATQTPRRPRPRLPRRRRS